MALLMVLNREVATDFGGSMPLYVAPALCSLEADIFSFTIKQFLDLQLLQTRGSHHGTPTVPLPSPTTP